MLLLAERKGPSVPGERDFSLTQEKGSCLGALGALQRGERGAGSRACACWTAVRPGLPRFGFASWRRLFKPMAEKVWMKYCPLAALLSGANRVLWELPL